ncbi:MAG TPA: hypothetical protein VFA46_05445 [Actinomycetes bacterium]|jgi:uncharacterized protein YjgD (DUF1641 family)|nr:hypothetical protein [Actinomycetes bacterium]
MTEPSSPQVGHLTPEQQQQTLERLRARIVQNADAIDQVLDTVELLAGSGVLAGLNAVLDEFDDNFSAATRPELMSMAANAMMLMGVLSQLRYEPFFDLAMQTPAVMNEAYPRFRRRTERLGLREAVNLLRSPEVAGALELLVSVLRAQRGKADHTAPPLPRTPGR